MVTTTANSLKGKHLLSLLELSTDEITQLIDVAIGLKKMQKQGEPHHYLKGKTMAMIFEKSSTRTRVSFEVGMNQLGGHALFLSRDDIQLGRGETVPDTAKVLSRYVDGIMIRAYEHTAVEELAANSSVPVINALTDDHHPCQALADLMTLYEVKGTFAGRKLAYVGDGNNVAHSLMIACAKLGVDCSVASPEGYEPKKEITELAMDIAKETGAVIEVLHDPHAAVSGADAVYTDVWTSMGWEEEQEIRLQAFQPYQVNSELMSSAKSDAIFLHCLPAKRGEEVTAEVIDGPQSYVFDEAENRLHVQKALMVALMG
ncbi:ornithine carbamoyltransferase [Bacillus sp. FJAT-49732]|uniref:Ornithine carbamoyltransferase n=1 Tax=Lederbergia citrisecunda TaxID=2833583 RepID=A0A942YKZ2_9BACI|nr:ornithine carbamoyltransferase [Lederbergia citrisecunda]MBS4199100.1 ornithine carbamoyltransferase [Lederbergia citrisecunda]